MKFKCQKQFFVSLSGFMLYQTLQIVRYQMLFCHMAYQPLKVIYCQIRFYTNELFYFLKIQFCINTQFNSKDISISSNSIYSNSSDSKIQFSIKIVYTQLSFKTVLFRTIQFSVRTVSI